jgi:NADPH-dependent 2,4-dienoyl-CoA reductase/sulfur reductase-like enzyme
MNNKKHFLKTNKVGFVLGAVLLAALTECAGNANAQGIKITVTPPILVVAPPVVVAPVVVVQDDYVYYPNYGVYYNSHRHQYYYLRGDAWVWAPAPEGVSVDVLLASPSVRMDFHDSPANHHAEMLQKYPRNWKSSDAHQDQKEDRKDAAPDRDKKQPGQMVMPPH